METAKEILYKKCQEKDDCFLSGQVAWIVEAMEEYASTQLAEKQDKIEFWVKQFNFNEAKHKSELAEKEKMIEGLKGEKIDLQYRINKFILEHQSEIDSLRELPVKLNEGLLGVERQMNDASNNYFLNVIPNADKVALEFREAVKPPVADFNSGVIWTLNKTRELLNSPEFKQYLNK